MRTILVVGLSIAVLATAPLLGASLEGDTGTFILWQLRVPRALLGGMVGATLGVVGAAFQTVFDNPLATPSTTGTTAGASLGALAVLVLAPQGLVAGTLAVAAGAFVGALVVTLLVGALAARREARIEDVLLAGIALTLASSALATGLQTQADQATTFRAVRWSLGSLAQVGYDGLGLLAVPCAIAIGTLLLHARALETLVGGEALAHAQGVAVARVRAIVLTAGALGVGAATAWCGPIAFVGLVVPHVVRRGLGAERRVLLPMSAVVGAAFLVGADAIARAALPHTELPVGVLTAAMGAPLLVVLVTSRRS